MQIKIISFAVAVSFSSCHSGDENKDSEESAVRTEVTVVRPKLETLSGYTELNATTQYQRKSTIRATVTGYIGRLDVVPGDVVNEGKILCYISTKEQEALRGIDTSELKGFNRPLAIICSGRGIVSAVSFRSGDFVSEGDAIITIAEPSSLMLRLNVPFEYRNIAHTGTVCEVILPDGSKTAATILQQMPSVDVASQTQAMLLRITGNQALPENMNAIVHIPLQKKPNALCVPRSALQTDEAQSEFWVMKVVNDSLAVKINVQCGLSRDSIQEIITDKISVSDDIISDGGYGLVDSSFVIINK